MRNFAEPASVIFARRIGTRTCLALWRGVIIGTCPEAALACSGFSLPADNFLDFRTLL
jgi:hypothetical protein